MKKSRYFIMFAAAAVAVSLSWGYMTYADTTEEKEVKQVVEDLMSAASTGDVAGLLANAKDLRHSDKDEQEAAYERVTKKDKLNYFNIEDVVKVDDSTYQVTVQTHTKAGGKQEQILPVVKDESGEWKVIIGQDVPYNPANYTEGTK